MQIQPRLIGVILCTLLYAPLAGAAERPNIVVFYTDDHGYADLSCQGVFNDIKTPHVDALAASGVRALNGYSTAPQCVPSRAGLLIGKFQSRFGVESNGDDLTGFNQEVTFAERLQKAGYVTGQFGKWHLGPSAQIPQHGFKHVYAQNSQAPFYANMTTNGEDRQMGVLQPEAYHVDGCSQAAASMIRRYKDQPLLLYIAYRAPHVPLDAPPKYLRRFPGKMPERRRQALAMLSAVDDGVGLVMQTLKANGLSEKTLVFYIGDNGAPLKIHKHDAPGGGPGWDGSLNDPLNGEKGMLSEGGMHTPFVVAWPGRIPSGQVYPHPISALDVAATATACAGIQTDALELDGVNLVPYLCSKIQSPPHDALMWRWIAQSAIRMGKWKLLRGADREYLFDLEQDLEEKHNVASKHPEIATRLRKRLSAWTEELQPPGLTHGKLSAAATSYFDFYLDGKAPPAKTLGNSKRKKLRASQKLSNSWQLRNGLANIVADGLQVNPDHDTQQSSPTLIRNGVNLAGPIQIEMAIKSSAKGAVVISWRTRKESKFRRENQLRIALDDASNWRVCRGVIPCKETVIHVRLQLPQEPTTIKNLVLKPARGEPVRLLK